MKQLLAILFIIYAFVNYSQQTTTTYLNGDGNKVLFKKKAEFTSVKTVINGQAIDSMKYYPSGRLMTVKQSNWRNDSISITGFYPNESLRNIYVTQRKNGGFYTCNYDYYENGNLKQSKVHINYTSKYLEKLYYNNGVLKRTATYLDGKLDGEKTYYDELGKKHRTESFVKGKPGNYVFDFYKDGQVKEKIEFKDGKKNGQNIKYYKSGAIKSTGTFSKGLKINYEQGFYENGNNKDSCFYIDGKIEGILIRWFEDGKLKSKGNFSLGKKQGELVSYWDNGNLRRRDFYKDDMLVSGKCYSRYSETEMDYYVYETTPIYRSGASSIYKYLGSSIKYPAMAKEAGIQGKVYVQFVIDSNGDVTDVKVIRGIGGGCDEEAVKAVKSMGKWIPGYQDKEPIEVTYVLPVSFTLR